MTNRFMVFTTVLVFVAVCTSACDGQSAPADQPDAGRVTATGGGAGGTGGTGGSSSGGGTATGGGHDAGTADACAAIADLNLTSAVGTTVALTWAAAPDAIISVFRKTYCGSDAYQLVAALPEGTATYDDTTAQANWAYWYEITAVDGSGQSASNAVAVWASNPTPPGGCPGGGAPQPSGIDLAACSPTSDGGFIAPDAGQPPFDAGVAPFDAGTPFTGTVFNVAAGASTATIQQTVRTAAASTTPGMVLFAPGAYTITSQIEVPCPANPLIISGPTPAGIGTTWPIVPAVVLKSTLTNDWAFTGDACDVGTAFQYLEFNGGRPAGGGGGFLYVSPGMNNLTVRYNFFHGNQALTTDTQEADTFFWLDGEPTSARTRNTTISWNRFGATGDCSNLMNLFGGNTVGTTKYTYQGGSSYEDAGGECAAIGVHVNTDNMTVSNNAIDSQEQGLKFFEGGSSAPNIYTPTHVNVVSNDISGAHRIFLEAQQGGSFNLVNNDLHDAVLPGFASWGFSLAQIGVSNVIGNVMIANVHTAIDVNGQNGYWPGNAVEFWGYGTGSNNLVQGLWGGGFEWGFGGTSGGASWSIENNTLQMTGPNASAISSEEGQSNTPAESGNVTDTSALAVTSMAPTIASARQGAGFVITLTDPGFTSGALPQGNTSIYYTTDGSTPTTASTFYSGPFTASPGTTLRAIGMWGALNQPKRYPDGFGFVPSAVVTTSL